MMEDKSNSTVVVDIEKLQNFLKTNIDQHSSLGHTFNAESKTSSTICKVQHLIRNAYKSDYEPTVVCIGPYHLGKANLHDMEKVKWNCLEYILKANPQRTLHDYIIALRELYPVARSNYPDIIEMQSNTFLHMLLLDGCFVIAFICGVEWSSKNSNAMLYQDLDKKLDLLDYSLVTRDFLLIENQIPFFIVKRIYELFTSTENICALLLEKVAIFVEKILHDIPKPIKESERPRDFNHLLHLCHIYFRPTLNRDWCPPQLDYNNPQPIQWHRVVQYHLVGIKFKKKDFDKNNPHSLLDVSFIGDVLQIPYIFVDEITTTIFRNLIALEQQNSHCFGNHISTYIFFISQLLSTTKDVSLLVSMGIIGHHFESEEEVSNIFTSLGDCVVFDFAGDYYLKNICQNLEAYYRSRMKWGVGWLRRAKSAIQVFV